MAKRKSPHQNSRSRVPDQSSTTAERVAWLLESVWSGNRSEMGRAIGVTHSVLGKIAAGKQSAGRELLSKLAEHPKINPTWLLTGSGEPLLASDQSSMSGLVLPIADHPLPGPTEKNRSHFLGPCFPVAGAYFRASRYWLRFSDELSPHNFRRAGLRPGDLILMETDYNYWATESQVANHIVVASQATAGTYQLCFARLLSLPNQKKPVLVFEENDTADQLRQFTLKIEGREVQVEEEMPRRRRGTLITDSFPYLKLDDILAIGILVVRTF